MDTLFERIGGKMYAGGGRTGEHERDRQLEPDTDQERVRREKLERIRSLFLGVKPGARILVHVGKDLHVLLHESWSYRVVHRNMTGGHSGQVSMTPAHVWRLQETRDDWMVHQLSVDGPQLSFLWDEDLDVHLPISLKPGIVVSLAGEQVYEPAVDYGLDVRVITSDIPEYLIEQGVSERYVRDVFGPITHDTPVFELPSRHNRVLSQRGNISRDAGPSGSFFYVAGPGHIAVWGINRYINTNELRWGNFEYPSKVPMLFMTIGPLVGTEGYFFPIAGRGAYYGFYEGGVVIPNLPDELATPDLQKAREHFASSMFGRYYPVDVLDRYAALLSAA